MPFKWQIMVGDKEWCHHFKRQGKPAGMQDTACHPTKETKLPASTRKMLTVVFDTEGPLIQGFKSCNDTSNVNCYCQTLQKLYIKIKNHLHNFNDGIILLHNTHPQVAPHTSGPTNARCWDVLKYPANSPDLSPWNFHIFWPLKQVLKGCTFKSNGDA